MLLVKLKNPHNSFSILESKLWHSKKETKNVTVGGKMVKFIKTCDQYDHKFWSFFQLHNPSPFLLVEK